MLRNLRRGLVALLILCLGGIEVEAGTIQGVVSLEDAPRGGRMNRRYSGSDSRHLKPAPEPIAILWLEAEGLPKVEPLAEPAVMVQDGLQFHPSLLAVPAGSAVLFPNKDQVYHNVFSYSKSKRFDLGRFEAGKIPDEIIFDEVGEVKIFCEIHKHMRATILVLDTPYYVSSDTEGAFRFEDIPAGEYLLKAWVGPKTQFEQTVRVEAEGELQLELGKTE